MPQEQVERASLRSGGAQPAAQERGVVVLGEGEEDRELGLVVEVARDHGERVLAQDLQQLVVAEAEAGLQERGGGAGTQKSWFSPPKTSETESSVKIRRIESVSRSAQESTRM